ncbi:MAG TPA: hypothetical protein VKU38_14640, partial [Ktedonobacteraceae bacterium]|nr:hypothetical protein [Ktedonobacteraceae bacterium]
GFIAILAIYIVSNASFGGPDGGPTLNNELTTLAIAFLLAILVIFFCLILYAVGAFLVYLSPEKDAQQSAEQESDEAVEIISIPEVS